MSFKSVIVILGFVLFAVLMSCGGEKSTSSSSSSDSDTPVASETKAVVEETAAPDNKKGRLIFKQYCVICHGADGKLAVSNAKDLSVSTLPMEERINQITNGKGLMTPYKDILSADQIEAVAMYIEDLRK